MRPPPDSAGSVMTYYDARIVFARVGGVDLPVIFAGDQGSFPPLDQLNVQVPVSIQ